MRPKIILASASKGRLGLLEKLGIIPDQILHTDIDETEYKGELPKEVALRLAIAKAHAAAETITDGIIIAADTITCVGRKILPKALDNETVKYCLQTMSGRRHRIYSGLCVIMKKDNTRIKQTSRVVESIIKYKRLTEEEIAFYMQSKEGLGKSGGTTIQGLSQIFIEWMSGSYSNIIGLPLNELYLILQGFGVRLEHILNRE